VVIQFARKNNIENYLLLKTIDVRKGRKYIEREK
jgi:hypothetical protein